MSMLKRVRPHIVARIRLYSSRSRASLLPADDVDDLGLPTQPTWSVDELLSRSASPSISPATLEKLHKLSALITPTVGSPEHAKLTAELEDMVKLVEAVRHVDVEEVREEGVVPDGRIWQAGRGLLFAQDGETTGSVSSGDGGKSLLDHAQRSVGGFYVVEHDRKR